MKRVKFTCRTDWLHKTIGQIALLLFLYSATTHKRNPMYTQKPTGTIVIHTVRHKRIAPFGESVALLVARRTNNQPKIGRLRVRGLLK